VSSANNERSGHWREDLGVLLWAAFLAAALATMIFFAFLDPVAIADDAPPLRWFEDRMTGYTIGFFFFWAVCIFSSWLTAWLIKSRRDAAPEPYRDDESI
jgi:hypothetical protein